MLRRDNLKEKKEGKQMEEKKLIVHFSSTGEMDFKEALRRMISVHNSISETKKN